MKKIILLISIVLGTTCQSLDPYRVSTSKNKCHGCLFNSMTSIFATSKPTCNLAAMLIIGNNINQIAVGDCFDMKTSAD